MMNKDNLTAVILFLALGICPLLAGLAFFWGAGQRSTVTCTRLETNLVDCTIERAFLGLIPTEAFTVARVTGTELDTNCEDNSCTYALLLVTEDEAVPLGTLATSELENVEAEQARLDEFLANTEAASLAFTSGPAWIGMLITIPFILLGAYITIRGIRAFLTKSTEV